MNKQQQIEQLKKISEAPESQSHRWHSRVHPLRTLTNSGVNCFIKRDDELSFSISGSKIRKYLSLIPFLVKKAIKHVVIIGGSHSNNVLGLTQQAIENGIQPILFLREAGSEKIQGNRFFIELLVEKQQIRRISRADWGNVEIIAQEYVKTLPEPSLVIPEGACMDAALPGALTLPLDIICNEQEEGLTFDHVFIEAGTGLQAIALILGLHAVNHTAKVHVVLLADSAEVFEEKLADFSKTVNVRAAPSNYQLHIPSVAPCFGSVNREIFQQIRAFAQQEGLFLDPVYTAKLVLTGKQVIQQQSLKGNILFIHSGGALSLSGFQDRFL